MSSFPRSSGILLHPTSLPGAYGIGDLGPMAYRFVDWLEETGQSIWQMLPLGPTSYRDSPYQTLSAFAGNPNLISIDEIKKLGWLSDDDLGDIPDFPTQHVDFGWVIQWHNEILHKAYLNFKVDAHENQKRAFHSWCDDQQDWLDDYGLFVVLKDVHDKKSWVEWEPKYALRDSKALAKAKKTFAGEIEEQRFRQWLFYVQWYELKYYANRKGIKIIGDIPIFVAHDSADVWSNRDLYYLNQEGYPTVIAGVPPDYFSPTGQRWGNPLYRWDKMANNGYAWWIKRLKATLSLVDYVRIDHFRGFEAYWEIPATEKTAIKGTWIIGPGTDFFRVLQKELGQLPIIAEDLGVITKGVAELRDQFELPGMKVLQFAWDNPENLFLPHNHSLNCVVYTGTHDNNTTIGWFLNEADDNVRGFMQNYLGYEVHEINWSLMRVAMMSPAHSAIFPMQDVLNLGHEGRMNTPGTESNNWMWRFEEADFNHDGKNRLSHLTWLYRRRPDQQKRIYGHVTKPIKR